MAEEGWVLAGRLVYWSAGACILALLVARVSGQRKLAAWLDLLARAVFGLIALGACVFLSGSFRYQDAVTNGDAGPAPSWEGRIFFGIFGVAALFTAARALPRVLRGDYSNADTPSD